MPCGEDGCTLTAVQGTPVLRCHGFVCHLCPVDQGYQEQVCPNQVRGKGKRRREGKRREGEEGGGGGRGGRGGEEGGRGDEGGLF